MRVYEIAREVGIPNKDLLAKIRAMGLDVNNHMSSLDADDVAKIKRTLERERGGSAAPVESKAAPAAAPGCTPCGAVSTTPRAADWHAASVARWTPARC